MDLQVELWRSMTVEQCGGLLAPGSDYIMFFFASPPPAPVRLIKWLIISVPVVVFCALICQIL